MQHPPGCRATSIPSLPAAKAGAMQEVCGPRSATCRQRPSQPLLPHQEGDLHLSQVKIHSSNALAARISVQDISCCLCPSEHSWTLLQPGAAPEPPNHGKNEIKSSQRACGAGQHVHTIHWGGHCGVSCWRQEVLSPPGAAMDTLESHHGWEQGQGSLLITAEMGTSS